MSDPRAPVLASMPAAHLWTWRSGPGLGSSLGPSLRVVKTAKATYIAAHIVTDQAMASPVAAYRADAQDATSKDCAMCTITRNVPQLCRNCAAVVPHENGVPQPFPACVGDFSRLRGRARTCARAGPGAGARPRARLPAHPTQPASRRGLRRHCMPHNCGTSPGTRPRARARRLLIPPTE